MAARAAEQLGGPVGDDLVGVHVAAGAAAGLVDDQREVVVEPSGRDLAGGLLDRRGEIGRQAVRAVDPRGGLLDVAERVDDLERHALADVEVLDRALGLRAPQSVLGHLDLAHAVALGPHTSSYLGRARLASLSYPLVRVLGRCRTSSAS
jgi:hypothetical protein